MTTPRGTSRGRAQGQAGPAPRPIAEVRENMLERARALRNPFSYTRYEEVEAAFARLDSLDRDQWAAAFSALAPPYEARAAEAEAAGDTAAARENYLIAYDYYHIARYPAPNSPGKLAAYRKSQENYLKAARYFDPPLAAVEMPFQGRSGEGSVVPGHLRKPAGAAAALPLVVLWGGIDSFKEDRPVQQYLDAGFATLSIDMPGVADSPVAGSEDAERSFDAIFDWIATRPDLDAARVGLHGGSTGGYWATKVAHTHRDRVRAAINQGGPAHFAFEPDWIVKAQYGEYPFELAETLASAFGRATYQEWVEYAPRLSLVRQGVLDQPCAPLLCVNGVNDSVFPVQDMYVLLEHGDVKDARLFVAGHMGNTPQTQPIITRWLREHLTS
ncbi:MAG TPA: alpha/beta fold hydrolase [Chloroflexota bacterium]|jgi:pimeloyl-ACP methyl ester carboxylesterase